MAKKQTGIYRVDVTLLDSKPRFYYYGRNAEVVREAVKERFCHLDSVHILAIDVLKVGNFAYTINEPVVPFTEEETRQIENYYFREMIKNESLKARVRAAAGL